MNLDLNRTPAEQFENPAAKYLFNGEIVKVISVTDRQQYTDIGNAYPEMIPYKKKRVALIEHFDGTRSDVELLDLIGSGVPVAE